MNGGRSDHPGLKNHSQICGFYSELGSHYRVLIYLNMKILAVVLKVQRLINVAPKNW